jgi:hypothetical protein
MHLEQGYARKFGALVHYPIPVLTPMRFGRMSATYPVVI